jgi:hypothetical protein
VFYAFIHPQPPLPLFTTNRFTHRIAPNLGHYRSSARYGAHHHHACCRSQHSCAHSQISDSGFQQKSFQRSFPGDAFHRRWPEFTDQPQNLGPRLPNRCSEFRPGFLRVPLTPLRTAKSSSRLSIRYFEGARGILRVLLTPLLTAKSSSQLSTRYSEAHAEFGVFGSLLCALPEEICATSPTRRRKPIAIRADFVSCKFARPRQ